MLSTKFNWVKSFIPLRRFLSGLNPYRTFALLFATGLCLSLVLPACTQNNSPNTTAASAGSSESGQERVVRIGYQKSGTLILLKAQGTLEKRLASLNAAVEWREFLAGPPLLEALNAGSIDFGHTGDAPAVFAQVSGAPFRYIANTQPSPESVAMLVPKNSPIRQVNQLKGKKVAFTKGSSAHYFVVKALAAAKLQPSDIKAVYLSPADARTAFEQANVDAWAIWDPYYAAAQQATGARVLVDGKGLTPFREFYLASQNFADDHADLISPIVAEIQMSGDWAIKHPQAVAEFLSPKMGIDVATLAKAEHRRKRYGAKLIEDGVVAEQQEIANTFYRLGLVPKQIDVKEAILIAKQ